MTLAPQGIRSLKVLVKRCKFNQMEKGFNSSKKKRLNVSCKEHCMWRKTSLCAYLSSYPYIIITLHICWVIRRELLWSVVGAYACPIRRLPMGQCANSKMREIKSGLLHRSSYSFVKCISGCCQTQMYLLPFQNQNSY